MKNTYNAFVDLINYYYMVVNTAEGSELCESIPEDIENAYIDGDLTFNEYEELLDMIG